MSLFPFSKKLKVAALYLLALCLVTACFNNKMKPSTVIVSAETPELADILREQFSIQTITPSPTSMTMPTSLLALAGEQVSVTPSKTVAAVPHTPMATEISSLLPTPSLALTAVPQVQVALNAVYLRHGPGLDYPILSFLYRGDMAEVIASYDTPIGWYHVRLDNSLTGWVGANVVQPVGSFDPAAIPTAATIPPTSTATPTHTPTATPTPPPRPPHPTERPSPSSPTITPLPTVTVNPYP